MNQEIKERWVQALRSGTYQQTHEKLRDNSGYCCLGVLCDIVAPDSWELHTTHLAGAECQIWETHLEAEVLPPEIINLCGLISNDPEVRAITPDSADIPERVSLAHLNDKGFTFLEIAQLIEDQL